MFAVDPLFLNDVDATVVLVALIKVLTAFAILLVAVILMVWFERKVISDMQNRIGPNRAGPFGLLQTLADGMKLIFKEDLMPRKANRFVFLLAPYLAVIPAFLTFALVPISGDYSDPDNAGVVRIFGKDTYLQLADPPMGILLLLAVASIGVYGVMLAGWASGSKYPLLGSVRATAQMVSYEAAMALSVVTTVLISGGLSTHEMVVAQAGGIANWNVIVAGVVPFCVFFIAGLAEMNRPPFDLVEAEQELVGGFHTEYSSIRFGIFFVAEFMHPITMSGVIVTLWFGGPTGFFDLPGPFAFLTGVFWFTLKVIFFLYIFVLIRGTLPRFRYDQLMNLGWKVLIPLSLGWLLVLATLNIGNDRDWPVWQTGAVIGGSFVIGGLCYAALAGATRTSEKRRQLGTVEV